MIFFFLHVLELLDRDVVLAQEALEAAAFFAGGAGGQADVAAARGEHVNQVRAFELLDDPGFGCAQGRLC